MRKILILAAAAAMLPLVSAVVPTSAQAANNGGGSGNWCLVSRSDSKNCSFATRAQCMALLQGVGGNCDRNTLASRKMKRR
ncbi:MAG: DUF3551 domain-containing protein [Pseudolabrys sp.]|nr:DUF3551 domain-containing protein [Pseudolabrys sp.]